MRFNISRPAKEKSDVQWVYRLNDLLLIMNAILFTLFPRRTKEKHILGWLERFNLLLQAGHSLVSVLEVLRADRSLKIFREVTDDLMSKLDEGIPLKSV